jgi:hypothetical protein
MSWQSSALAGTWFLAIASGPCTSREEPATPSGAGNEGASAQTRAVSSAPTAPPPPRQTPTARKYMLTHFAHSEDMRRALIADDLTALHAAAEGVAKDEWTPSLRSDWRPHVDAVRHAARKAQTAASLEAAATAFADLGAACSSCHRATGGPGSPRFPTPSPDSPELMLAHEIATERLWQGLIAPSDQAWLAGAKGLLEAPELDSDVQEVAALTSHVRDLARRAKTMPPDRRGRMLADLLLTCASCHRRVTVRPGTSTWTPSH